MAKNVNSRVDLCKSQAKEIITNLTNVVRCPICLEFPADPILTKCGHYHCRTCLLKVFGTKSSTLCVTCRTPLTKRSLAGDDNMVTIGSSLLNLIQVLENELPNLSMKSAGLSANIEASHHDGLFEYNNLRTNIQSAKAEPASHTAGDVHTHRPPVPPPSYHTSESHYSDYNSELSTTADPYKFMASPRPCPKQKTGGKRSRIRQTELQQRESAKSHSYTTSPMPWRERASTSQSTSGAEDDYILTSSGPDVQIYDTFETLVRSIPPRQKTGRSTGSPGGWEAKASCSFSTEPDNVDYMPSDGSSDAQQRDHVSSCQPQSISQDTGYLFCTPVVPLENSVTEAVIDQTLGLKSGRPPRLRSGPQGLVVSRRSQARHQEELHKERAEFHRLKVELDDARSHSLHVEHLRPKSYSAHDMVHHWDRKARHHNEGSRLAEADRDETDNRNLSDHSSPFVPLRHGCQQLESRSDSDERIQRVAKLKQRVLRSKSSAPPTREHSFENSLIPHPQRLLRKCVSGDQLTATTSPVSSDESGLGRRLKRHSASNRIMPSTSTSDRSPSSFSEVGNMTLLDATTSPVSSDESGLGRPLKRHSASNRKMPSASTSDRSPSSFTEVGNMTLLDADDGEAHSAASTYSMSPKSDQELSGVSPFLVTNLESDHLKRSISEEEVEYQFSDLERNSKPQIRENVRSSKRLAAAHSSPINSVKSMAHREPYIYLNKLSPHDSQANHSFDSQSESEGLNLERFCKPLRVPLRRTVAFQTFGDERLNSTRAEAFRKVTTTPQQPSSSKAIEQAVKTGNMKPTDVKDPPTMTNTHLMATEEEESEISDLDCQSSYTITIRNGHFHRVSCLLQQRSIATQTNDVSSDGDPDATDPVVNTEGNAGNYQMSWQLPILSKSCRPSDHPLSIENTPSSTRRTLQYQEPSSELCAPLECVATTCSIATTSNKRRRNDTSSPVAFDTLLASPCSTSTVTKAYQSNAAVKTSGDLPSHIGASNKKDKLPLPSRLNVLCKPNRNKRKSKDVVDVCNSKATESCSQISSEHKPTEKASSAIRNIRNASVNKAEAVSVMMPKDDESCTQRGVSFDEGGYNCRFEMIVPVVRVHKVNTQIALNSTVTSRRSATQHSTTSQHKPASDSDGCDPHNCSNQSNSNCLSAVKKRGKTVRGLACVSSAAYHKKIDVDSPQLPVPVIAGTGKVSRANVPEEQEDRPPELQSSMAVLDNTWDQNERCSEDLFEAMEDTVTRAAAQADASSRATIDTANSSGTLSATKSKRRGPAIISGSGKSGDDTVSRPMTNEEDREAVHKIFLDDLRDIQIEKKRIKHKHATQMKFHDNQDLEDSDSSETLVTVKSEPTILTTSSDENEDYSEGSPLTEQYNSEKCRAIEMTVKKQKLMLHNLKQQLKRQQGPK